MKFIQPNWDAPDHIKAFTTVKTSWGTRTPHHDSAQGFYTSNTNEDSKLKQLLDLPNEPIWVKQTHSTIALPATLENKEQVADATFTTESNRVCVVLTADCLPILICNKTGTSVAAIHAGWRGLANGIIESTIANLQEPSEDLLVWLGPAIGPRKFEVGRDVYTAFTSVDSSTADAFLPYKEEKWLANLYELAKIRLRKLNITHIYGGDYCTYTQEELFFSYRRDQGKTGRMASLIWISGNSSI